MNKLLITSIIFGVALLSAGSASATTTYSGVVYVAGEGGHIAKAQITIDPTAANPITINALSRIVLGRQIDQINHDVRIDQATKKLYWSTIVPDRYGDAWRTGEVTLCKANPMGQCDKITQRCRIPLQPGDATFPGFCASGQTADYYLPVMMGWPQYVDVVPKSDVCDRTRVVLDDGAGPMPALSDFIFAHGTNSPSGTEMYIVENDVGCAGPFGLCGTIHSMALDMSALLSGTASANRVSAINPGAFGIAYRQGFSSDGSLVAQSYGPGGMLLLSDNGSGFSLVDFEPIPANQENHDNIFTPDDKYVVMTLRVNENKAVTGAEANRWDGHIQLYDVANKQKMGQPVSVCWGCHDKNEQYKKSHGTRYGQDAQLCGIDAIWD